MSRLKHIYQAMDAIFEADLSHKAKMVYLNLCRRADAEGKSFPTINRIAKDTGMSQSSVERAIRELVLAGWITKHNRLRTGTNEYTSNEYTIHIPNKTVKEPPVTVTPPNTKRHVTVTEKENNNCSSKINTNNNKDNVVVDLDTFQPKQNPDIERLRELLKKKNLQANYRTLQYWLSKSNIETVVNVIEYAANKQAVRNIIGYITSILQSGYIPVVSSSYIGPTTCSEIQKQDKYAVFYEYYKQSTDKVI